MGWEGRFGKANGCGGGIYFLGTCVRDSCYDQGRLHKVIDECGTFSPALATYTFRTLLLVYKPAFDQLSGRVFQTEGPLVDHVAQVVNVCLSKFVMIRCSGLDVFWT